MVIFYFTPSSSTSPWYPTPTALASTSWGVRFSPLLLPKVSMISPRNTYPSHTYLKCDPRTHSSLHKSSSAGQTYTDIKHSIMDILVLKLHHFGISSATEKTILYQGLSLAKLLYQKLFSERSEILRKLVIFYCHEKVLKILSTMDFSPAICWNRTTFSTIEVAIVPTPSLSNSRT